MDLEQKYKVVYVTDIRSSLDFFMNKVGLKKQEELNIPGRDCAVLKMFNGDFLMLLQNEELEPAPVVLHTDDCLRDHYRLKEGAVEGLTEPVYRADGVAIEFADPCGNRFVLLEERDYTDA
jgi:hypothetical protein